MFLFWANLADRLGSALGSGGFDHGCETVTSVKDLDPWVAFVVGWEIGAVASLGDVGNLGTGVPSPCDWKIGAATSIGVVRDLGTGAFLSGAWRIGAAMPFADPLSGTQTSVAWRDIGADGPPSFVTGMGVPDNSTTERLSM